MSLKRNPVHRRVIIPWYDSNGVCWALAIFLAGVIVFSLVGISVANATPHYREHVWLPLLLLILSASGILITLVRLSKRHFKGSAD